MTSVDQIAEAARALLALVAAYELVVTFVAILLEDAGLPLPAPGDLIIAFYASRHVGDPSGLVTGVVLATGASTIGANVPYFLGGRYGPAIVDRLESWLDLDRAHVVRAERWLAERGLPAFVALRVVPGLRMPAAALAGAARMPRSRFVPGVLVGSLLYWTMWTVVGITVGGAVTGMLDRLHLRFLTPLFGLALLGLLLVRRLARRARRAA